MWFVLIQLNSGFPHEFTGDSPWLMPHAMPELCPGSSVTVLAGAGQGSMFWLARPWLSYQYRSLLTQFHRADGVSWTSWLEPGTWALSGVLLTGSRGLPHMEQEQGWGWKGAGEFGWGGKSHLWHTGKPQQAGVEARGPSQSFPCSLSAGMITLPVSAGRTWQPPSH